METNQPDERDERDDEHTDDEQQGEVTDAPEGDPDASSVDDAENTDHLERLADPDELARARELDEQQGGERYGSSTE